MEQHKPKVQVKTYMEHHGTFQYKTGAYFLHMRCASLRWHTLLSRPISRGRLCKNQGRTMQNCRKHTGRPKKKHGKWSSTSQKCRSKHTWSFQYKTGAYFLHMGVTPSTPHFQQMRGIAALILDGLGVFTHYDATQKWGRAS